MVTPPFPDAAIDGVTVNGVPIAAIDIAMEMQNHPADAAHEAWNEAACALVVRELLLQEARRRRLQATRRKDARGPTETLDEALISTLLEQAVQTVEPDDDACRRHFEAHRAQFRSPDLVEASHILYAADPEDADAIAAATRCAEASIAAIAAQPHLFDTIARSDSACPSAANGGRLGQLSRGQMVPEFDTFLFALEEGQLCPVPVKTRFGAHVLRVSHRITGQALPFDAVRDRIAAYLAEADWRRRVAAFIEGLAKDAVILGVDISSIATARHESVVARSAV